MYRIHKLLIAGLAVLLAGPAFAQAPTGTTGAVSPQQTSSTIQANRLFGGLNTPGATSFLGSGTASNPTYAQNTAASAGTGATTGTGVLTGTGLTRGTGANTGTTARQATNGLQFNRVFGGLTAGRPPALVPPSRTGIDGGAAMPSPTANINSGTAYTGLYNRPFATNGTTAGTGATGTGAAAPRTIWPWAAAPMYTNNGVGVQPNAGLTNTRVPVTGGTTQAGVLPGTTATGTGFGMTGGGATPSPTSNPTVTGTTGTTGLGTTGTTGTTGATGSTGTGATGGAGAAGATGGAAGGAAGGGAAGGGAGGGGAGGGR